MKKFVKDNFDVLDPFGNYKTIPIKCHSCLYYESGDSSVGLEDGCECPQLYDKEDEIIEAVNEKIADHMSYLGYTCPFYRRKPTRTF